MTFHILSVVYNCYPQDDFSDISCSITTRNGSPRLILNPVELLGLEFPE